MIWHQQGTIRDSIELNVPWWGETASEAQRKKKKGDNESREKPYQKKKESKLRGK